MEILAFAVAALALVVGTVSLRANPTRFTNQVFALISLMLFLEAFFIYAAITVSVTGILGPNFGPLPWVRANAAIIGFFPWALWLMKEAIVSKEADQWPVLRRSAPWLLLGVGLAAVCYTEEFIPSNSPAHAPQRGIAYLLRAIALIGALLLLTILSVKNLRTLSGIRYVSTKFLVVGGVLTAATSVSLVAMGTALSSQEIKALALGVTLFGYTVMAWAMTIHRVFDARQVLVSCAQRSIVVLIVLVVAGALVAAFDDFLGLAASILISFIICGASYIRVDKWTRKWLGIDKYSDLSVVRNEVVDAASLEHEERALTSAFERLLSRHCNAGAAVITDDELGLCQKVKRKFGLKEEAFEALLEDGWVTPESLERKRVFRDVDDLLSCMHRNSLGLMCALPSAGRTPTLFIALGKKPDEWPYTYPEIERWLNIAELMDNIISHTRIVEQAAVKVRLERWAFVSRSLAHDLKNLMAPVSAFVSHMEGRVADVGPEAEAHAAAIRAMRAVDEYTREVLLLGKSGEIGKQIHALRDILTAVAQIAAFRASQKEVKLAVECEESIFVRGDAVLLERLFVNLVLNAIDASPFGKSVAMVGRRQGSSNVKVLVCDEGRGISRLDAAKIFEPFVTSKSYDAECRSFGLGLPIAKRIAELHNANIAVVSEAGSGAIFVVEMLSCTN